MVTTKSLELPKKEIKIVSASNVDNRSKPTLNPNLTNSTLKADSPRANSKFTCPIDNLTFSGKCPRNCWFNSTEQHASGCLRLAVNNQAVTMAALPWLLQQPKRKIRASLTLGQKKLQVWLKLLEISENEIKERPHCPHCFMPKNNKAPCLNVKKCKKRQKWLNNLAKNPKLLAVIPNFSVKLAYTLGNLSKPELSLLKLLPLRYLYLASRRLAHL